MQSALKWARDLQSPETYFEHLGRPGFGSREMCDFVEAFRAHMRSSGGAHDDHAVWQLLRQFLVLPFDFEHAGSQAEQVAHARCEMLLAPAEAGRAAELWDTLVDKALSLDSAAGEATPESARRHLAQASDDALSQIRTTIRGFQLPRLEWVAAIQAALEGGRYVEIQGAGGVGKSAVLASLARQKMQESVIAVLAPDRVPRGGWDAMRAQLGLDEASAKKFLADMAGDGGGVLFVDGLDRFDDPGERATMVDLLRAAADVPGFCVVATERDDFRDDRSFARWRDGRRWPALWRALEKSYACRLTGRPRNGKHRSPRGRVTC